MAVATSLDRSDWAISSPLHNKLAEEDRSVHAWYRFVLSFPPHLVDDYLCDFGISPGQTVLDPFCGTGTTLVETKKHRVSSIGFEANPIAAFASQVKTDWTVDPAELVIWADQVVELAESECQEKGISLRALEESQIGDNDHSLWNLRTLNQEEMSLLLKGSINPLPLHKCLAIHHFIERAPVHIRGHLRLALAWVSVAEAGNIRFGPEVGITKLKKVDAPVFQAWRAQVERMAGDILEWNKNSEIQSKVFLADAREPGERIALGSLDAVFTSPPYPNEKDYTRTTRLESVILGFLTSRVELRKFKESLLRSNTRNVFVKDRDHLHVEHNVEVQRIAAVIEAKRKEMGKTSGFEKLYHRVTKLYFGGMARHLAELRPLLKRGAMLGYVVGDQASYLQTMIRTGELLKGIAVELGYEHVRTDLFRTRLATATREQLREEVLVLRWKG